MGGSQSMREDTKNFMETSWQILTSDILKEIKDYKKDTESHNTQVNHEEQEVDDYTWGNM